MAFGGTISVGVLIVAALMLATHGFDQVEDYHQLPLMLIPVFGLWGFVLLIASLAITCLGAALEVELQRLTSWLKVSAGRGARIASRATTQGSARCTRYRCFLPLSPSCLVSIR